MFRRRIQNAECRVQNREVQVLRITGLRQPEGRHLVNPHFSHRLVARRRRVAWMQGAPGFGNEGIVVTMSRSRSRAQRCRQAAIRLRSRDGVRNAGLAPAVRRGFGSPRNSGVSPRKGAVPQQSAESRGPGPPHHRLGIARRAAPLFSPRRQAGVRKSPEFRCEPPKGGGTSAECRIERSRSSASQACDSPKGGTLLTRISHTVSSRGGGEWLGCKARPASATKA